MHFHVAVGVVLCSVALAQESAPSDPAENGQPRPGVRAGFWWADYDRDGLPDAFAVGVDGAARLLRNNGDGSFDDVTLISGLDGLGAASFAAWQDFDRDGAPDLLVGTQSGPGHLLRNAGDGTFQDVTQFVGLNDSGRDIAAQWFDYDLDGLVDLSVRTDRGEHLYHALPNGHFEAVDLSSVKALPIIGSSTDAIEIDTDLGADVSRPSAPDKDLDKLQGGRRAIRPPTGLTGVPIQATRFSSAPPAGGYSLSACPPAVADSFVGGCLQASSTPTLGMLYPLTINLNVSGAGNVGIGTTTPAAKLDVAGTARMSDTLTLSPSGDQALNVNSGSIYKGGILFAHTKGSGGNTAIGLKALLSVTGGTGNTASGYGALLNNTTGDFNTANGYRALSSCTIGTRNTASGYLALSGNTTGSFNTASGARALYSNTTGSYNTASGYRALESNTSGSKNIATGYQALRSNSTGSGNTANGYKALLSNTTGNNNVAMGRKALYANTTGYRNTASGYRALYANTTGYRNTASGARALYSNTTASENTASGFEALRSNTTGFRNTASGEGALRSNTTAHDNTASGFEALYSNTTGLGNTAMGSEALHFNTIGFGNIASGGFALFLNTSGGYNTASGHRAMFYNTTGRRNTASGYSAMAYNTTGYSNTADGNLALLSNTTGNRNIAVGAYAGNNLTTGSNNIAIGNGGVAGDATTIRLGTGATHTRTFIAGIRGKTTGNANAIPVLIDSAGQLGTVSSSRRFKKDIVDMGDATENLLKLRPVRFRYKQEQTLPDGSEVPMEYGLIAEEVAEIFPDLVVYDDQGKPFTVKYHILSSMLLNELEKLEARMETRDLAHARELEELRSRLALLEARTDEAADPRKAPAGSR